MKTSLRSGSSRHSWRWPVLAALLLLSFGASARGGHDSGGRDGWSGGGHSGGRHADGRHDGRHGGGRHSGRLHRGGHAFIGLGFWPSWDVPYAYGYPLPDGLYASPVYVERADEAQSAYWYYCADARAYYPNVTQCSSGWLRVIPGPASQ